MRPLQASLAAPALAVFALALSAAPPAAAATLDTRTLPYLSGLSRQEIAHDFVSAAAAQGVYTLAVSPAGSWDSVYDDRISVEERARNALQRCEHRARLRCLLVVQNGAPTGEKTPRSSGLVYAQSFDAATVPFVPREVITRIAPRFAAGKPHRAMAVNANGWIGIAVGRASPEEAGKVALDKCQGGAGGKMCFLYAVDDAIVFTKDTKIY